MIICKRPAPPDDHLQEAAPSGGGAYGQRYTGHFTTLGRIVEEKEEEILAGGRAGTWTNQWYKRSSASRRNKGKPFRGWNKLSGAPFTYLHNKSLHSILRANDAGAFSFMGMKALICSRPLAI